MPPPFAVRLVPYDPAWRDRAAAEIETLRTTLGSAVIAIHHIGSTSIPGIAAKPVIDLLLVATDLAAFDAVEDRTAVLGYRGRGEYGLAGRRYLTRDDPSGVRVTQVHGYAAGDPAIRRHIAFRDHLRARPRLAAAYEDEKRRCASLHPDDSHAYTDCKATWIVRVEAEALAADGATSAAAVPPARPRP